MSQDKPSQQKPARNKTPVVSATYREVYSGPLPHPDIFNKYPDDVRKFILTSADKQSAHRHKLEQKIVDTDAKATLIGAWATALICVIAVVGGFVLIMIGKDGLGIVSVLVPVVLKGLTLLSNKAERRSPSDDEELKQ